MVECSNSPKISVVMCTYNTEEFLVEAIESILAQTFQDFEFIIWDDGSTDNTKAIVEKYKDARIRYFYHVNTGLGMALRLACAEAKGEYIARMDSDDISLPERFATEVAFLDNHPEYVLVSSAVYDIDENGKLLGRVFPCSDDRVLKGVLSYPASMISHPMVMMRRDAYERAGGYIPIRKSQDMLFWSRIAKQGKFYNIPTPLGKYRILSNSLGHACNPYAPIFWVFLRKMINDEIVLDSDVDTFNSLYQYSKQYIERRDNNKVEWKKTWEEKVFSIACPLLGNRFAQDSIVGIKNLCYLVKLHLFKIFN